MSDELKYWVRCIVICIVTVVALWIESKFGVIPSVLFVICMWVFEILQIVNVVKGVRDYLSDKWNVFSFALFVVVSLAYILFCGWYFAFMSIVMVVGLEGLETR